MNTQTENLPTLVFRPSWKKWVSVTLFCLFVFWAGINYLDSNKPMAWASMCFGALGLFIGPIHFLTSRLVINTQEFRLHTLFKAVSFEWDDVVDISTIALHRNSVIAFNFTRKFHDSKKIRLIAKDLAGFEGGLPDTYGMDAKKLADLMMRYQQNFLSISRK